MANTTKKATLGARILEGLDQAISWSDGKKIGARVTPGVSPKVDVKELRKKMGLSQAQFATRFGLPPGTLRNWEQGRATPDAPTQVLLAVIARHPEAVEDSLRIVK